VHGGLSQIVELPGHRAYLIFPSTAGGRLQGHVVVPTGFSDRLSAHYHSLSAMYGCSVMLTSVRFFSVNDLTSIDVITCLKRLHRSANADVVTVNPRNSLIFGKHMF
jgi:hypothetical protein